MKARPPIRLRVKCASALLALTGEDGQPLIPHEDAKLMTSFQIISRLNLITIRSAPKPAGRSCRGI